MLAAYQARVAEEGEYDEQELPADLVDELEGAAGPAQATFAVRMQPSACGRCRRLHSCCSAVRSR